MRISRWTLVVGALTLAQAAPAQTEDPDGAGRSAPPGLAGPSRQKPAAPAADEAPANGPRDSGAAPGGSARPGASEEDGSSGEIGGYSWSDKPPRPATRRRPARRHRSSHVKLYPPGTPVATYPGFRVLPGGQSLVWVAVSQTVSVREERQAGRVVYVLEGARVEVQNNTNALVTTHFVTPISRVQLVPTETGLQLVIELRTQVELEHTVVAGPHGAMVLRVAAPPIAGAAAPAPQAAPEPSPPAVEDETDASAEASVEAGGEGRASAKASASANVRVGRGDRRRRRRRH